MTIKPHILLIGPTPPPFYGVAVAIQMLLDSTIADRFRVSYLDLADRRGIQYVNKPDLHDVSLFCRQWTKLIIMLFRERQDLTYLVLSQSAIGFFRDSLLIWPTYLRENHTVIHLHGRNLRECFLSRNWLMRSCIRSVLGGAAY